MGIDVSIKKQIGNFFLDVAFQTEDEIFAILGASGCGKSMTLKCIAGIETPDEGHIILNGRTLFDSAQKINVITQERKVGYMFQDYALFPNMTVEQNITIGMGKNPDPVVVREYIDRFRLSGLEGQIPVSGIDLMFREAFCHGNVSAAGKLGRSDGLRIGEELFFALDRLHMSFV